MDKPLVYWVQDGDGVPSCHVNDGRLNHKDSMIGRLLLTGGKWTAVLKNGSNITPKEGCPSLARARMCMEAYAVRLLKKKAA